MASGKELTFGALFGALLFVLIGSSFIAPVNTSVENAKTNITDASVLVVVGLITLIFAVGLVYAIGKKFIPSM